MIKRIISILLLIPSVCLGSDYIKGHPLPLDSELLNEPVALTGECSDVSIVEWHGSTKSKSEIERFNHLCNKSVRLFPEFIKKYGAKTPKVTPSYKVSVLPDDSNYRSLNDFKYRFLNHSSERYAHTDVVHKHLFIDLSHSDSSDTIAHEIYHQLSWESGLFNTHKSVDIAEDMADKFAKYVLAN